MPWNENDLDLKARREKVEELVKETFKNRTGVWVNPIFYRDSIRTVDELREALRLVLPKIRAELHKLAGKAVPGETAKPEVSNEPVAGGVS